MISIITTAYNNTIYIKEAIDSFIESCENYEYEILIGVDNCRKTMDNLISLYPSLNKNIKIYFFKNKVGTYIIRNSLVKLSKYNNIIFFDSDDVMRTDTVKSTINSLQSGNDYFRFKFVIFNNKLDKPKKGFLNIPFSYSYGAFGIKKSVFLEMNGFEPWICASDGDFFWRIQSNKYKISQSKDVNIFYRRHDTNLTSSLSTGMKSQLRKKYHEIKNDKIKRGLSQPLEKLNTSNFLIVNDEFIENYRNNNENFFKTEETVSSTYLTIIIPTFNNPKFLDECLESIVISLKNHNIKVMVGIDNCQKTLNHINSKKYDERIIFYYFNSNVGPYVIKNTLSQLTDSEFLLFFDSDDIMCESLIENILTYHDKYVFTKIKYKDFDDGRKVNMNKTDKLGEGVFSIRKDIFISMNGFEGWRCAADSDFKARLYKLQHKFIILNETGFYRRIHLNSLTRDYKTGYASKLRSESVRKGKMRKTINPEFLIIENSFYKVNDNFSQNEYDNVEKKNKFEDLLTKLSKSNEKIDYNILNNVFNNTVNKNIVKREIPKINIPQNNSLKKGQIHQELIKIQNSNKKNTKKYL
jgi:glycosyltransferase involved in cell wall biosynthesis